MSIRSKLTILFLVIALIPAILVGMLSFSNYNKSLESVRFADLQDTAALKADKIETYFSNLKTDIEIAQGFYNIKKNLPTLTQYAGRQDNPEFISAKNTLNDQLRQMQSALKMPDIMLTNPEGKVVYSTNPAHSADIMSPLPDPGQKGFSEGKKKAYFTDIFFNKKENNKLRMLVTAPAFDFNGRFIGVIAFEIDMDPVYDLLEEGPGLGKTGEILIGKKSGDRIVYLNPLNDDPQAPLKRSVPIGGMLGGPVQEAALGKTGAGRLIDYRGKDVIAAWLYIPSMDWGMVVKIDAEEAFADINKLQKFLGLILSVVSVLMGIMSVSIARSISRPINNLAKGVEIVGKGNLDYKVGTDLQDEIGHLSRAFDDMTAEQKRAQESLRSASIYARSLLEASLDPMITISADGKITDVNEATIKSTGRSRQELIGTDFSGYFTEPEKARAGYQRVFAKSFVTDYPLTICHKDGRLMEVLYNAVVYRDIHGNVTGVFAAARDVTLLNKAEAELRRHRDSLEVLVKERTNDLETSNRKLAQSNENLEQFAYVASHDLQEPLRIMSSYSQLLERRYRNKLDKDADEFIDFIVAAAFRMQRLITDLLAYSRLRHTELPMTEVDSERLLSRVVETMAVTIREKKAEVTHDTLPVIMGYEINLMQLFQNLIGNAIKFSGKEAPRVHIGAKKQEGEWLFSVKDNGIGIEGQYRDRIFMIFQRLHGKDEYAGTGIGLAICKKIVENHGGRIWVESELNKGSTFYFTIPTGGMKND